MKLTKCENKHFYDADKYDHCPHCEKPVEKVNLPPVGPSSGKPSTDSPPETPKRNTLSPHTISIRNQKGDLQPDEAATPKQEAEAADSVPKPEWPIADLLRKLKQEAATGAEKSPVDASVAEDAPAPPIEEKAAPPKQPGPLQRQVDATVSHGPQEDMKTIAYYDFDDVEPVVGWLVCVGGEYFGQSFNLKAGQNFIGRGGTMDVTLAKDTSVSRNKHAVIIFDPQSRGFFVQPGESTGLTYLNGELLLTPKPLAAHGKIKVGNSEFIFFPCCGEQFAWEDYV